MLYEYKYYDEYIFYDVYKYRYINYDDNVCYYNNN